MKSSSSTSTTTTHLTKIATVIATLVSGGNNNTNRFFCLLGLFGIVQLANATTSTLSHEDLVDMSLLTLDEFNQIRGSESPNDFGGLASSGETDQLWMDAAVFEYEVATSYSDDKAATSPGYHPYVVCSSHPELSGDAREKELIDIFQNTPNVSASDYYRGGNLFHNSDDLSCGVIRAYDDSMHKVYQYYAETDPNVTEHLKVNPLHASMKMSENTVGTLEKWFAGEDAGTAISTGSTNPNTIKVRTMTLQMLLCPGVQDFGMDDVPDEEIEEDVKNFVIEDGGKKVADLSFYNHRVSGMDGDKAVYTERMSLWDEAITKVMNWTMADGSNACLDRVVGDNMEFHISKNVMEVKAKYSFYEAESLSDSIGFAEEDMETCIWYMTYALAVSPQICTMEPEAEVRTLCKDGTDDLSKCPPPESMVPPDSSSSSRSWVVSLLGSAAAVVLVGFGL